VSTRDVTVDPQARAAAARALVMARQILAAAPNVSRVTVVETARNSAAAAMAMHVITDCPAPITLPSALAWRVLDGLVTRIHEVRLARWSATTNRMPADIARAVA